jgi:hypothetical protein
LGSAQHSPIQPSRKPRGFSAKFASFPAAPSCSVLWPPSSDPPRRQDARRRPPASIRAPRRRQATLARHSHLPPFSGSPTRARARNPRSGHRLAPPLPASPSSGKKLINSASPPGACLLKESTRGARNHRRQAVFSATSRRLRRSSPAFPSSPSRVVSTNATRVSLRPRRCPRLLL